VEDLLEFRPGVATGRLAWDVCTCAGNLEAVATPPKRSTLVEERVSYFDVKRDTGEPS
jgi:hypothetical protein